MKKRFVLTATYAVEVNGELREWPERHKMSRESADAAMEKLKTVPTCLGFKLEDARGGAPVAEWKR